MSEVQIRSAVATDLPTLMAFDHTCTTDYVWQMDLLHDSDQVGAVFREIRLPRSVIVSYPRPVASMADEWSRRTNIMVAVLSKHLVGYLRLTDKIIPQTAWVTDLAVVPRCRRQGVGTALVLAAQSWAIERKNQRMIMEMPSKNHPAICLAQKLRYEFCGYNDHYYASQDVALFFGRALR